MDATVPRVLHPSRLSLEKLRQTLEARYQIILFLIVLGLILIRAPDQLVHPRIWAEEILYLNYALNHGVWDTLLYSKPSIGYYLLTANIPAVLAAIVSKTWGLEYAPVVTTYFSLAIQLIPFPILLYEISHLFRTRWLVAFACVLIVLAPTTSGEVWLNILHTKSWTGLAVFLLLFVDMSRWSKRRVWFYRLLVLFCGVSGPYGAILSPIFVLSYFVYRERERLVYAAILFACCIVHLALFLVEIHSGDAAIRTQVFTLDSAIVNVFVYQVMWSVFGYHSVIICMHQLGLTDAIQKSAAIPRGGRVLLAAWFSALVIVMMLKTFWRGKFRSPQLLLITSFLLYAGFTASTALRGMPHNRYTMLPGLAILLLFLSAWDHPGMAKRILAIALLSVALYSGIRDYRKFWNGFSVNAPVWTDEVQKWRKDPSYQPRIWPPWFPRLDWHPSSRK